LTGTPVRLALMHAANFTGFGFFLPFFPIWLDGNGLGKTEIGIVLAVPMVVRMLAAPWISGLADRHLQPGTLLALLNAAVMAGYLLLWPLTGFWPIAVVMLVTAIGLCGIIPVADALTNAHVQAGTGVDYGRVRVWGSVSFLVTTLAGGWVIKLAGAGIVPPALAACSLCAAGAALLAPGRPAVARATGPAAPAGATGPRAGPPPAGPRRRLAYLCLLGASAMVQACHGALYAFGTLYWQAAGHDDAVIGALWAIGVAAEIVLFACAGRLGMRGEVGLRWIMIGAVAAMLRFALMPFTAGLLPSFVLQLLHALSFGLTHLGAMAAITMLAPDGARGRAQGQLTAAHAIAIAAATVLAGVLYGRIGALTFMAMAPVAFAGLILALIASHLVTSDDDGRRSGGYAGT
jgi:MFS transporter, PPP family, 3-phenylpropionic acid transporter